MHHPDGYEDHQVTPELATKGTELSLHNELELDHIADQLNDSTTGRKLRLACGGFHQSRSLAPPGRRFYLFVIVEAPAWFPGRRIGRVDGVGHGPITWWLRDLSIVSQPCGSGLV